MLISILWQGNGTIFPRHCFHMHVIKIGVMDNPPYYLLSLRGCPVTFLERLAASASLGFEPRTFGSEVPSFTHPATEAAMF